MQPGVSPQTSSDPGDVRHNVTRAGLTPSGLRLGSLFGAPIYVAPSWLIFLAWITVAFAPLVDANVAGIGGGRYAVSLAFGVFLGLSVLAHEIGHCAMAQAFGVPAERVVLTWLAGHSAFEREPGTPRRMALVALAGPAVNIALAAVAWWGAHRLPGGTVAWVLVAGLAWTNGVVGVYNLLPGLPLDGGQVLRAVVWAATHNPRVAIISAAWAGRVLGAATVFAGLLMATRPSGADQSSGVWAILIGLMIVFSSSSVLRQQTYRDRLPRLSARALARRSLSVSADLPLAEAVRRAHEDGAHGLVVVDGYGRPTGVVQEAAVVATPAERRPWVSVGSLARGVHPTQFVPVGLAGEALLDKLRATPASEYVVVEPDGAIAGVLAASDIAGVLRRPR
jgi:Zn-dependent protease